MPWTVLLPFLISMIKRYGVPWVEKRWPALKPIIEEILALIGGGAEPSAHLLAAAVHYNELRNA